MRDEPKMTLAQIGSSFALAGSLIFPGLLITAVLVHMMDPSIRDFCSAAIVFVSLSVLSVGALLILEAHDER